MGGCSSKINTGVPSQNPLQVDLSHFKIVRVIGKGGFAEVLVARHSSTKNYVAIKQISKRRVLLPKKRRKKRDSDSSESQKELGHRLSSTIWVERDVLMQTNSVFLAKLLVAFQDKENLYLVMPFLSGGDLQFYLTRHSVMREKVARFCCIELILALEALHKLNIVYRDLKPRNIMLTEDGHICLTDFGLCKVLKASDNFLTTGKAGTAGFRAPEVLDGDMYGFSVDFFSLGVTMYKLMIGRHAYGKRGEKFDRQPSMKGLPKLAADLLTQLLEVDHKARIGCRYIDGKRPNWKQGWQQVKEHRWFADIDWEAAKQRKLSPPYIPNNSANLANFPTTFSPSKHERTKANANLKLTATQQALFEGFEYNTAIRPENMPVEHSLTSVSKSDDSDEEKEKQPEKLRSKASQAEKQSGQDKVKATEVRERGRRKHKERGSNREGKERVRAKKSDVHRRSSKKPSRTNKNGKKIRSPLSHQSATVRQPPASPTVMSEQNDPDRAKYKLQHIGSSASNLGVEQNKAAFGAVSTKDLIHRRSDSMESESHTPFAQSPHFGHTPLSRHSQNANYFDAPLSSRVLLPESKGRPSSGVPMAVPIDFNEEKNDANSASNSSHPSNHNPVHYGELVDRARRYSSNNLLQAQHSHSLYQMNGHAAMQHQQQQNATSIFSNLVTQTHPTQTNHIPYPQQQQQRETLHRRGSDERIFIRSSSSSSVTRAHRSRSTHEVDKLASANLATADDRGSADERASEGSLNFGESSSSDEAQTGVGILQIMNATHDERATERGESSSESSEDKVLIATLKQHEEDPGSPGLLSTPDHALSRNPQNLQHIPQLPYL